MHSFAKSIFAGILGILLIGQVGVIISYIQNLNREERNISQLQLELALAKTENRALAQKLAACQTVEREPKPILNF